MRRRRRMPLGGFNPNDVPQADANALINLYNATKGSDWTDNTNWLSDPVVGNWYGVTVAGGRVTKVDLNGNNLNGTVGAEILPGGLEELQLYNNGSLVCDFTLSDLPIGMTHLHLSNTSSTITGALSDLPIGMAYLYLSNTSSMITGALSDLPSGMKILHLYNTSSMIAGALSDLPSGIAYLYLYSTSSTITGGASAISATGIRTLRLENISLTQAEVDGIAERLYTDWASLSFATPELNIGADDAEPSGIYQAGDPPTTGKEYIYELVNDPKATGNNTWSITYNTGSGNTTVP